MNANILQMLLVSEEEWMTESTIKQRVLEEEPPPSGQDPVQVGKVVDRLLETLVDKELIEFRTDKAGTESYKVTNAGIQQLIVEQTRKETSPPPPHSWVPAPPRSAS